jgi:Family of unknown function (DUF5990)
MKQIEATFRIILEQPTAGVDFGLQKGHGSSHEVVQKQRSNGKDLAFEFTVTANTGKDREPNFTGPFVQGPTGERFVYINIGTFAGQIDTCWSRRLKIPLAGISWKILEAGTIPVAHVPGTGKDGGPSCAYSWRKAVGPSWGWRVER